MSEVRSPLLPGKGIKARGNFNRVFNQCQVRLNGIKQKNDLLQKTSDNDLDRNILKQIKRQGDFIQKQTKELHKQLQSLKSQFRDPQAQNKIKKMLNQLSKQVQRNKKIMTNYIQRVSAISAPRNSYSSIIEDQKGRRQSKMDMGNRQMISGDVEDNRKRNSNYLRGQQQQVIQIDLKIQQEKKKMLDELQVRMNRVNEMANDMALQVDGQGEALDIIGENMTNAYNRVEDANQQLEKAQGYQKKSKKKYIICLMIVILIAVAIGGVVFLMA